MVRRHTVVTEVPAESVGYEQVQERDHVFDPHRIVALIAGLGLLLLGALVLIDTGFGDFPSLPVTEVAGFTQTPLLGALDVLAGLLLLAGAADWDRSISVFTSAVMLIGGIVIVAESDGDKLPEAVRANSGYGWMLAFVGAVVLIVALVMPAIYSRRRVVETDRSVRGY